MLEILQKALLQLFDVPPETVLTYFFCMLLGVTVNWLWKCKREKIDPIKYWTDNKMSTFYSLAGAIGAFIATMIIEPGLGKQTYFAMGIACDAMLNKPPLPAPVQAALLRAGEQFSNQQPFEELTDPKLAPPTEPPSPTPSP